MRKYILKGKQTIPCDDLMLWAEMVTDDTVVKQERIGKYFISTIFLGTDYSLLKSDTPILFETMVLLNDGVFPDLCYQERCYTYGQAEQQHEIACQFIKEKICQHLS